MKTTALLLLVILAVSTGLPYLYGYQAWRTVAADEFHFGVTYGFNTTEEAKLLIDKVKDYTDLFVVDSWDVATNETMLNEICEYAANAGLKVIVYFDLISGTAYPELSAYPWHKDWLVTAKSRWGDKFLGIYLHDELGGKQLEEKLFFENASDYSDAANRFVANLTNYPSNQFAKNNNIPLFIADFGLYWWDYLGGYDTVFVELGWNHNTTQQIAFCRGAANMQGKDWGAIIVWKEYRSPYLGSKKEVFDDMLAAYTAGAKYVVVFNHPRYPESNPYGVLAEEHFEAMKEFHDYVRLHPRYVYGRLESRVAFVLPKDYGWGARRIDDNIWGLWPADGKAQLIWKNMNTLTEKYGFELDIVFDDTKFPVEEKYGRVYFWNETIL